ncbi:hypothetical protein H3N35_03570 [Thalassomonas haliotis]|uniref:Inner membrane protein n=1 Tax=Thalassomonas haliotis TaxID=485448 RepID=A0ABY7VKU7_9GAMM|nr:hypothetical protein H3N35_03570 [Thalassomonas haliotis]
MINSPSKLFLCGGEIDATAQIPPSFRDRLYGFTAKQNESMHNSFILAEAFKDYFKDNRYPDLLVFEEDIAQASTLVIILLESPGSLVELGLFCNRPDLYHKLLIVAPQEQVSKEDSFIYLGPLEYIRKKSDSSVQVFPWPDQKIREYDSDNLEILCSSIEEKVNSLPKTESFKKENKGHIAYLIYSLVFTTYPVLTSEIELALEAMDITVSHGEISRLLYLLNKLELVNSYRYSSVTYYYPVRLDIKKVTFGKTKQGLMADLSNIRVTILQSLRLIDDESSKKRRYALKRINSIIEGVER